MGEAKNIYFTCLKCELVNGSEDVIIYTF